MKHRFYILGLTLCIVLNACSTAPNALSPQTQNYLLKAENSTGQSQYTYQLLAAKEALKDRNILAAKELLNRLSPSTLDFNNQQFNQLLRAKLALATNDPLLAIRALHQIKGLKLQSIDFQKRYYQTAINAHLRNNNLAYSTIARISYDQFLADPQKQINNENIIWHDLQQLSTQKLQQLLKRSTASDLRGWLSLALVAKENSNQPQALIPALANWQQNFPSHPANRFLPTQKNAQLAITPPNLQKVALLLPLSGSFAGAGKAIRDGFMSAFYQASGQKSDILVFDTHQQSIDDLYQEAISNGATMIIGPLLENNVEKMVDKNPTIPVIALNYTNQTDNRGSVIEFGVSPENAAIKAAKKMQQKNIKRVLFLAPENSWGEKISDAFLNAWSQKGQITDTIYYTHPSDLKIKLPQLLGITQSKARSLSLSCDLGQKLKSTPYRRKDIDAIFLIASPHDAVQISALLRFYYAGNLPTYSIFEVYRGYPNPIKDRDLNGIIFNDFPFLITKNPSIIKLRQNIANLWPQNYQNNVRFYALGIDSYLLTHLYYRLRYLPTFGIKGVTGRLCLNQQKITRQFKWAIFDQGNIREY